MRKHVRVSLLIALPCVATIAGAWATKSWWLQEEPAQGKVQAQQPTQAQTQEQKQQPTQEPAQERTKEQAAVAPVKKPMENKVAEPIYRVPTRYPDIAFTFNLAKDKDEADFWLDLLANKGINDATFFISPTWATRNPAVVRNLASRFEVGLYIDCEGDCGSEESLQGKIMSGERVLTKLTRKRPSAVRYSTASLDNQAVQVAAAQGFPVVQWGIDSSEWPTLQAGFIVDRLKNNLRPGDILLLDTKDRVPHMEKVFSSLVDLMQERKYNAVTISRLLQDADDREMKHNPGLADVQKWLTYLETTDMIERVPTKEKKIALTFDIGWGKNQVRPILDVLNENKIASTFFLPSTWAEENRALAEKIRETAEIGSRGLSQEEYHLFTQKDQVRSYLNGAAGSLAGWLGKKPTLLRFPYGQANPLVLEIARDLGFVSIRWGTDARDWEKPNVQHIVKRVLQSVSSGDIVLLNASDSATATAEALKILIPELRKRGYQLTTVSDLLNSASDLKKP